MFTRVGSIVFLVLFLVVTALALFVVLKEDEENEEVVDVVTGDVSTLLVVPTNTTRKTLATGFPAGNTSGARVAMLMIGFARSFVAGKGVAENIQEYLWDPLIRQAAYVDLYWCGNLTGDDGRSPSGPMKAFYVDGVDVKAYVRRYWRGRKIFFTSKYQYACADSSRYNVYQQRFIHAWSLVKDCMTFVNETGIAYDWVVRARPDVVYFHELPLLSQLDAGKVTISQHSTFSALSDHFWFTGARIARYVFSMVDDYCGAVDASMRGVEITPERHLLKRWEGIIAKWPSIGLAIVRGTSCVPECWRLNSGGPFYRILQLACDNMTLAHCPWRSNMTANSTRCHPEQHPC